MQRTFVPLVLTLLFASGLAHAQAAKSYPVMAPLSQYLIADRNAEIALARSAAPASISDHAEVLVLTQHGYETAVKGTNGFVCFVERGWTKAPDDPDFWNPRIQAPFCINAPAAETYLPITVLKTQLALAGKSSSEIGAQVGAAFDQKKLPPIARGAMCYMMSKQGHLSDADGHWRPHLMFFAPLVKAETWGANADGSPLFASEDPLDRVTIFMVPVGHWSDGSLDTAGMHH